MPVLINYKDKKHPKVFVKWVNEGADEVIGDQIPELKGTTEINYSVNWMCLSTGIKRSLSIEIKFDELFEDEGVFEILTHIEDIQGYDLCVILEDNQLKIKEIFRGKNITFDKSSPDQGIINCLLKLISN